MNAQAAQAAAHAVLVEVNKRLAPAVLANLQTNADYIALYLEKNKLEWNADNAVAAINALHAEGKIMWLVDPIPPAQPTKAERDAKAAAQQFRDSIKNKPKPYAVVGDVQNINASDAQATKQAAEAKQLESLKAEIAKEINGYFVGHPSGGRNYGRSEEGQNKLRAVASNYNQLTSVDAAKRVLENVKTAKHKLP